MKISPSMMAVFAAVAVAQVMVPASLIVRHELTLQRGQPYKFKTAPVDPYDAFRGRYVALRFDQSHARLVAGQKLGRGQKAFATIETGKDGFARFTAVSVDPPRDQPYLRVHALWANGPDVNLELPFDRFYMEEHIAPAAEQAYWQNNRRGQTNTATYALVRVRAGTGVIENLYIGNEPISRIAREQLAKRPAPKGP